ncbi:Peptide deformylase [Stanieria cyanosphaera PCC 7437]|uniref:Peptide deformylase n=1 Tax=Stanieria cyanosphaera (strain ATCC 29371 / PCC 7437) TaxID=111780 RepID=K9Y1T9_STAC7|nr:peptide deformylase [Stanieria cyanosphaera]AFZ37957.1 Peptide deformylase [Stanieria cyanosphaera PCC 7437]
MTQLEIAQLGNPILRQKARLIENFNDPNLSALIDSLLQTVASANGVGIAAPQVSQSYRVFVIASRPNIRYPHAPMMQPTVMINPQIIAYSEEKVQDWEGCLSIPGLRGLIRRYQTIEVEYYNREGQKQRQILTDFVARIFQHELDHLDGLVFLDRLNSNQDLYTEEEYQKIVF